MKISKSISPKFSMLFFSFSAWFPLPLKQSKLKLYAHSAVAIFRRLIRDLEMILLMMGKVKMKNGI